jgi:hypothetical protein
VTLKIQGDPRYRGFRRRESLHAVPTFLLSHQHPADECPYAFAAWRGFDSPLRHRLALSSCMQGGHALWWVVDADTEQEALGQLPEYVSRRSEVIRVRSVPIP